MGETVTDKHSLNLILENCEFCYVGLMKFYILIMEL